MRSISTFGCHFDVQNKGKGRSRKELKITLSVSLIYVLLWFLIFRSLLVVLRITLGSVLQNYILWCLWSKNWTVIDHVQDKCPIHYLFSPHFSVFICFFVCLLFSSKDLHPFAVQVPPEPHCSEELNCQG